MDFFKEAETFDPNVEEINLIDEFEKGSNLDNFVDGEGKNGANNEEGEKNGENGENPESGENLNEHAVNVNGQNGHGHENSNGDHDIQIKESKCQQTVKKTLKKLLQKTPDNTRAFCSTTALKIYKQFKKKRVNAVTKFRGPLEITPNLGIDVCVYTKSTETRLPSLKKFSLATEFSEDPKKGLIQNEKVHYVFDDPEQTPIPDDLKVKSYFYGKRLVPITKTEEEMFKNGETRVLKAIGFTDSSRVPRHYFLGGCDIVIPNPTSESDKTAFTSFVQGMIELNKYLICRFVPRANADAKLVVLIPCKIYLIFRYRKQRSVYVLKRSPYIRRYQRLSIF